jgi:hypothetical protein
MIYICYEDYRVTKRHKRGGNETLSISILTLYLGHAVTVVYGFAVNRGDTLPILLIFPYYEEINILIASIYGSVTLARRRKRNKKSVEIPESLLNDWESQFMIEFNVALTWF